MIVQLVVSGIWLVSAGVDKNIRIWDPLRGTCVHEITCPSNPNAMLVWGEHLAISTGDTVRLWNIETRAWSRELEGHTNTVTVMAVCGHRLASGSKDRTVRVWDDPGCAHLLTGHTHIVFALVPLPDNRLASSSSDRTVRVWDTQSGLCLFTLEGHARSVDALAFNGKLISGSYDFTLRVWDIETGECLHKLEGYGQGVRGLAVIPGNLIASFSVDKKVQVWDVESGELFIELVGHTQGIMCAISLPDGRFASGSLDCSLRVWG
jgi:WD40 repeat protein